MRPNYKKACWSCESKNMEPVDDYYKCRDCGATYNVPTIPGELPITKVDFETGGAPRVGKSTRFRPRGGRRHAAKAVENT